MRVLMVGATGRHRLAQPYSLSAKFCSVDYRDVAEVAARAMTGGDASELSYGTFELSAPGMEDSHAAARSRRKRRCSRRSSLASWVFGLAVDRSGQRGHLLAELRCAVIPRCVGADVDEQGLRGAGIR